MNIEQPLNPLLPFVLHLLRSATAGLSEYELLKQLEQAGVVLSVSADEPDLALFQKHFVLMNALYQLQDMLWRDERVWLSITALRIVLEPNSELSSNSALSAASNTALRDYYLDWRQLNDTDSAGVAALLNGFWQRFHVLDARADALATLHLEANADWPQIRQQYRRLAAASHPDRGGDGAQFLLVREAYEVLRMVMQRP